MIPLKKGPESITELVRQTAAGAGRNAANCPHTPPPRGYTRRAAAPDPAEPARRGALYVGLAVLICQLVFVYTFFPSFGEADAKIQAQAEARGSLSRDTHGSRYATPDILQWSGAHSLTWIASLFAPDTPVRLAPALLFFLVAGGFFAAMYRPVQPGSVTATMARAARMGMRLWPSWFAAATILLIYLVTSAGGLTALRTSAGIAFPRSWKDIADAFLSHWLVYVAWFALLGFLPMLGGAILGLLQTRFLTRAVLADVADPPTTDQPDRCLLGQQPPPPTQ